MLFPSKVPETGTAQRQLTLKDPLRPPARLSFISHTDRQKAAAATSNNQVIGGNLPPDTDHYGKGEIEVVGWPNGIAGQNLFHSTEMPGKGKECGRTSRLEQHTL